MPDINDLERRIEALERQVLDLTSQRSDQTGAAQPQTSAAMSPASGRALAELETAEPATALVDVAVRNKRFQAQNPMAGIYQEAVWFDCTFSLHESAKPTRAVKGALEFCDIFGDPRFVIGYTLNDALHPGRPHQVRGIGFDYNEFMNDHQWMLGTDLNDMVVRFRVAQVMYGDGTSERIV